MRYYLVIFQDEWNNLYYMGEYSSLNDAIPDLNDQLAIYDDVKLEPGDLREYPGTFGTCFDLDISNIERYENRDDLFGLMVRGFVLYREEDENKDNPFMNFVNKEE